MTTHPKATELEKVVIRFVGDSGDGMQLTGTEFTKAAAIAGNDISTFPDFPAEIRAPAGSLAGVSGYQLHFSSSDIYTEGDAPDVLVVMNPAAFKTNIADLVIGGTLIVNSGNFTSANLRKAGYEANPLDDAELLKHYNTHLIDISQLSNAALADTDLTTKEKARCKNFFALGLLFWSYSRPIDPEIANIEAKFGRKPRLADANVRVFKAGYHYGETDEVFQGVYEVKAAEFEPGTYRNITGNQALALGLVAATTKAGTKLIYSSYPITPASSILHVLSNYKHFGVLTFQCEDEIAAMSSAVGAAYGGALSVTGTSGPGLALKGEALGLAVMTEVPLVIVNVQRGGPSTGLPTKTEQSDLLQAYYGRNGDCPLPILAIKTPADAFHAAIEAARIAMKYMVPVMLLSDGYLANGSEPWRLPSIDSIPAIDVSHRTDPQGYQVYARDETTLARDWVVPGTPGLEHRVGGLEKDFVTGNVSYDPTNHEAMVRVRQEKVERIVAEMGPLDTCGNDTGDVLLIGWGGTFGALRQATGLMHAQGKRVTHVHLTWMYPFNPRLDELIEKFKHVLVAELNMGQLLSIVRAKYTIDAKGVNKIQGRPFKVVEIINAVNEALGESKQAQASVRPRAS